MLSRLFKKKKQDTPQNDMIPPNDNNYQINILSENIKQISDSLSNITKAIRNLEARTQDITEKIEGLSEKVDTHDQELSNIKDAVEKMFALYDLVMKQYNPFLEEDTNKIAKSSDSSNDTKDNMENIRNGDVSEYEKYLPLDEIKDDPGFIAIIMGWLNYLVSKSSIEETMKALDYYEEVGWITENVKIKLEKYLEGYDDSQSKDLKLSPEDHLISLYIISKLKSGMEGEVIRFKDLYEELVNKGMIKPIRK